MIDHLQMYPVMHKWNVQDFLMELHNHNLEPFPQDFIKKEFSKIRPRIK